MACDVLAQPVETGVGLGRWRFPAAEHRLQLGFGIGAGGGPEILGLGGVGFGAQHQLQPCAFRQPRRRYGVERIERAVGERRRLAARAVGTRQEDIDDHRRVVGHRGAQLLGAGRFEPARQPDALRHVDLQQPPETVERDTGLDGEFELAIGGGGRHDAQAAQRAKAADGLQRRRQPSAVIGLFVDEILRIEQHAGGIVDALRRRAAFQRVEGGKRVGFAHGCAPKLIGVAGGSGCAGRADGAAGRRHRGRAGSGGGA